MEASWPDPGCSETQRRSNTVKLRNAQRGFSSPLPAPAPLYPELLTGILSTIHLNLTDAQSTMYLLGMKRCSWPSFFFFFLSFFNILMEASSRLYERKGRQAETPALGKQCFSEGYCESYNLTKFSKKTSETNGNCGVSKQFLLFQKKMGTEEQLKKCDTMTRFQRGNYADAAVKHRFCSPRTKQPNLISLRILLPA